jgi:biotin transport system substrate-specific component
MKTNVARAATLPLAPALLGASRDSRILLVGAAIALLWASAKIQIPLWPVPITMQTYVVLVIALSYGLRLGLAAIGGYVVMGALGLPVFAGTPEKGIGIAYLAGPTGGYVAGFIAATFACAWLAAWGRGRGFAFYLFAAVLGHAVILACGVTWLAATIGWERAVAAGLTPFLWGTALKTLMVAATLAGGARWMDARR